MPSILQRLEQQDRRVFVAVNRHRAQAPAAAVSALARFSAAGEYGRAWFALGALGAAVDRPRRGRWLRASATLLAAYGANLAVKNTVRRPRPQLDGIEPAVSTPTPLSFPSSHSATSFAAATAFRPLVAESVGRAPAAALLPIAAAMSSSRVYLGVHYPSDIAAGAALGAAVAAVLVGRST